jgi:hypothetical protein
MHRYLWANMLFVPKQEVVCTDIRLGNEIKQCQIAYAGTRALAA